MEYLVQPIDSFFSLGADSIVFGGNFLHSFGIEKQLQVAHIEEVTHVPAKFRYV